ncbi:MAG TPA: DUF2203 domain-containing protein [Planctomycetota bacterium]|jgi:hypothetical protein|nr:DUF2203 domain-containing protein [Planctomycetota bacterium]
MESKLISIEEANRMLPLLRQIVADIMVNWERIIYKRTELECLEKGVDSAGSTQNPKEREETLLSLKQELNYLIDRINCYIREVEELGCFVEEFKRGIINFPSLHNGRKVFLCWKPDEAAVAHWHELDESFNDRARIRDLTEFLYQKPRVQG